MSEPRRSAGARPRWPSVLARGPGERFVVAAAPQPRRRRDRLDARPRPRPARGRRRTSCWRTPTPSPCPATWPSCWPTGEAIARELPADLGERVLVAVDCASAERLWETPVHEGARLVVNVDHHQDNTRFGDLNLVEPDASSTAEVVLRRPRGGRLAGHARGGRAALRGPGHRHRPLRLHATPSPGPTASRRPCIEAGAEPGRDVAPALRGAAARPPAADGPRPGARPAAGGRAHAGVGADRGRTSTRPGATTPRASSRSCAGCAGSQAAALVREAGPGGSYRVSLRAADPGVDVSAIAREEGGGGHRAAAGFSTRRAPEELLAWLERRMAARLDAQRSRWLRRRSRDPAALAGGQARRAHLARHRGRRPPAAGPGRQGRALRHPRPVRHRPAGAAGRPRDAPRARTCRRWTRPTWPRCAPGSRRPPATPRGRSRSPGARRAAAEVRGGAARVPGQPASSACRPYAAVRVDGERLYRRARRGEVVEAPEREITIHRPAPGATTWATARWTIEVRCGGRHLRAAARGRHRRAPGHAAPTAPPCGAPPWGDLSVEDAVAPDAVGPDRGPEPAGGARRTCPCASCRAAELAVVPQRPAGAGGRASDGVPVALAAEGRLVAVGPGRTARASCGRRWCWRTPAEALPLPRRPAPRRAAARGRHRHLRRRARGPPGRHPAGHRDRPRAAASRPWRSPSSRSRSPSCARSCARRC